MYSVICQLKDYPGDKDLINSINLLIRQGANVNEVVDSEQNTPLHLAVSAKCHTTVLILIRKGANPCAQNACGKIPYELTEDEEIHDLLSNDVYKKVVSDIKECKTQPNTVNLTDPSAQIIGTGENKCIQHKLFFIKHK